MGKSSTRPRSVVIALTEWEHARISGVAEGVDLSAASFGRMVLLGAAAMGGATLERLIELGHAEQTRVGSTGNASRGPKGINFREKVWVPEDMGDAPIYRRVYADDPGWVLEKYTHGQMNTRDRRSKDHRYWWRLRRRTDESDKWVAEYIANPLAHEFVRNILASMTITMAFSTPKAMPMAHKYILERKASSAEPEPDRQPRSDPGGDAGRGGGAIHGVDDLRAPDGQLPTGVRPDDDIGGPTHSP